MRFAAGPPAPTLPRIQHDYSAASHAQRCFVLPMNSVCYFPVVLPIAIGSPVSS